MKAWRAVLFLALMTSDASAFCRTRTCSAPESPEPCIMKDDCAKNTAALYWPDRWIQVWVDPKGSPKRTIAGEDARAILEHALLTWTRADCGEGPPSIELGGVDLLSDESAVKLGLNLVGLDGGTEDPTHKDRINTLRFIDAGWQLAGTHNIAITTTTFGVRSGKLLSADIEVNSEIFSLTTSDETADYDLESILTHEAGHFLGLGHAKAPGPTMYGAYSGNGDLNPRTLEADDVAGICAIYPAGRFDDEAGCTCAVVGQRSRLRVDHAMVAMLGVFLLYRRRNCPAPRSALSLRSRRLLAEPRAARSRECYRQLCGSGRL